MNGIRAARQRNSLEGRLLGRTSVKVEVDQEEQKAIGAVSPTMGIGHRALAVRDNCAASSNQELPRLPGGLWGLDGSDKALRSDQAFGEKQLRKRDLQTHLQALQTQKKSSGACGQSQ